MTKSICIFQDRGHAGRALAPLLEKYHHKKHTLIIGLARGGIVVAHELAKELSLPLNVVVPRKIGAPDNHELALGAILENGEGVFNQSIITMLNVSQNYLKTEIEKEKIKAHERLELYRQHVQNPSLNGQTVILVDDGIATGATMLATIKAMRKEGAERIIVAVPVSSWDALKQMKDAADEVICIHSTFDFGGVSLYYVSFDQTEDREVVELLKDSAQNQRENEPENGF